MLLRSRHISLNSWNKLNVIQKLLVIVCKWMLLMDVFKIYWLNGGSYWEKDFMVCKLDKKSKRCINSLIEEAKNFRHRHLIELFYGSILCLIMSNMPNFWYIAGYIAITHGYPVIFQTYNIFMFTLLRDELPDSVTECHQSYKTSLASDGKIWMETNVHDDLYHVRCCGYPGKPSNCFIVKSYFGDVACGGIFETMTQAEKFILYLQNDVGFSNHINSIIRGDHIRYYDKFIKTK